MAAGDPSMVTVEQANFDVACMLFSSCAVMMMIIHMLNNRDPDLKKVSFEILSKAMCTLTGVLLSTSWASLLTWATGATSDIPLFKVSLCAFAAWYVVMHIALSAVRGYGLAKKQRTVEQFKYALHFWAPLVSIVGGASCMKVWAEFQIIVVKYYCKEEFDLPKRDQMLACFFAIFINIVVMKVLHTLMRWGREKFETADGKVEAHEVLWAKEVVCCEDNVDTMALAFMIVQTIRFRISGHMPLATGAVRPDAVITTVHIHMIFFASIIFLILFFLTNYIPLQRTMLSGPRFKRRLGLVLKNCTGFCWLFGGTWAAQKYVGTQVIGVCIQAAVTTVGMFLLIKVIDLVKDLECTSDHVDKQLQSIYLPFALLIGFAWKAAFAGALKTIATGAVLPAPVETWILTMGVCSIVLPGWRWYVLPVLFAADKQAARASQIALNNGNGLEQKLLQDA